MAARWLPDDGAADRRAAFLPPATPPSSAVDPPPSPSALPFAAAELAARFAARLLDEQTAGFPLPREFSDEPEPPTRDSKVVYLVMQVLNSMLNTTPAFDMPTTPLPALHRVNHSEAVASAPFHSTPAVEMATAGSQFGVVPVIIIGAIFAIATIGGNFLVMLSIRLDRQLQTISNYFLFALAFADLTIGVISIPLMTYYTSTGYWGIGWGLCQFWLSIDYLMSNASVLSLLLISFDRYFSITRPLTYRPRRTTKKALTAIFCAYLVSLILWPPWIIGWPYIEGAFTVEEGTCVVQFLAVGGNKWPSQLATIGTAIAAFYLPVSIMIYLYWRVYRETKRRQEQFRQLQAGQSQGSEPQEENCDSRRGSHISIRATFDNIREQGRGCFGGCLQKIRGIGARNAFPNDSDSFKERKGSDKQSKQFLPFMEGVGINKARPRSRDKISWLRYCGVAPPPVLHTYTVLIEYREGESKRPSVRLSSCDSECYTTTSPVDSTRSSGKRIAGSGGGVAENGKQQRLSLPHENSAPALSGGGLTAKVSQQAQMNGKFSTASHAQRNDEQRKSEKERRKNERRQESKAAKTLSAILFAFIVTWTPYNVIVVWEAFFPNSIPDILFTISYCLCYINSTINPICYATNGRFLKTYTRILRCRWNERRNDSLYRHAYLRRT
ncbi:G-PROTEIN-RECEP-F1-2 domain-containing protein [Aphelenchoides fujianensis]|nr:G-PROTEIN-RECEP-F1-2 domain-containing protein [Aphelenchoides fujianensis]